MFRIRIEFFCCEFLFDRESKIIILRISKIDLRLEDFGLKFSRLVSVLFIVLTISYQDGVSAEINEIPNTLPQRCVYIHQDAQTLEEHVYKTIVVSGQSCPPPPAPPHDEGFGIEVETWPFGVVVVMPGLKHENPLDCLTRRDVDGI